MEWDEEVSEEGEEGEEGHRMSVHEERLGNIFIENRERPAGTRHIYHYTYPGHRHVLCLYRGSVRQSSALSVLVAG